MATAMTDEVLRHCLYTSSDLATRGHLLLKEKALKEELMNVLITGAKGERWERRQWRSQAT